MKKGSKLIVICNGKSCCKDGANNLINYLKQNPSKSFDFTTKYCFGKCGNGPILFILPEEQFVERSSIITIKQILKRNPI